VRERLATVLALLGIGDSLVEAGRGHRQSPAACPSLALQFAWILKPLPLADRFSAGTRQFIELQNVAVIWTPTSHLLHSGAGQYRVSPSLSRRTNPAGALAAGFAHATVRSSARLPEVMKGILATDDVMIALSSQSMVRQARDVSDTEAGSVIASAGRFSGSERNSGHPRLTSAAPRGAIGGEPHVWLMRAGTLSRSDGARQLCEATNIPELSAGTPPKRLGEARGPATI